MKQAIAYARVSTDEQADNSSIESQTAACLHYAEQQGLAIVATFSDVISGSKLDRPGLSKARELFRLGTADALIVYCSDRLTRSLAHSLLLRDEFKEQGVAVHFVTKGESQHTPEGSLFDSIEAAFAEYERLKIAERMSRGRKAALQKGKAFVGAAAPFGYRYMGEGILEIVEEEADVVRNIFEWYVREGLGTPRIINRLAELQVPSPADRRSYNLKSKSKRGRSEWCSTTILYFLRNPIYKGIYEMHHAGETIIVPVPPIVDSDLWEAAAQCRSDRKRFSMRNSTYLYLLRGRIRCKLCGAACTGTVINGQKAWAQRYYACLRKYHTTMYIGENGRCTLPGFRIDQVEPAVWGWIDQEVLSEAHIRDRAETQGDIVQEERDRLERERATYSRQLDELDGQIGRLAQLFAAGLFQMEEIAEQKSRLDATKASCRKEVARLDALLSGMQSVQSRVDELTALVQTIRAKLDAGISSETKRRIIDLLDVEVLIGTEDEQKYAYVTCQLTLDAARLLVSGVEDISVNSTDMRICKHLFGAL